MLTLYQFPISHYCEKVRWALDYKGVPYQVENWLPGLHLKKTKGFVPKTSVPIVREGETVVQGSPAIISWLDERFPERSLTPSDPVLKAEALEWESYADRELGDHVRRFAYHTLLEHPGVVIPFFVRGGKWWWSLFLRVTFPKTRQIMRRYMNINAESAEESRQHIEAALANIADHMAGREFMVGDCLSRADIAAAALIAPLFMPPAYGLQWPARMPEPLHGWVESNRASMAWAEALYSAWRHKVT